MSEQTASLPCPGACCRSCGGNAVSCQQGERFNTFHCATCGEVVPCKGGFARAADINRLADPNDLHAALRAVGGCLSCGCDVVYPRGGSAGLCVNCGEVEAVAGGGLLRFRRAPGSPSLQLLGKPEFEPQRQRKMALLLQHPDESPEISATLPYLIHPPSRMSSTAKWIAFRDKTLRPLLLDRPDDPFLPLFLRQVEAILAFRATVPEQDRFWKSDGTAKTA